MNASLLRQQQRRVVVVTGMGAVTPLGNSFQDTYAALCQNTSGATSLVQALEYQYNNNNNSDDHLLLAEELERASQLPCQVAAAVRPFQDDALLQLYNYNPRTTARFVQFALRAAHEALEQAGLDYNCTSNGDNKMMRTNVGVSIGSGMSSVREIARAASLPNFRKLSPHFVPLVLSNSASGRVAIQYGFQGPNLSSSTACAAGTHAIGDAVRCIQNPHQGVDVMLAGGAEAAIDALSLAGFCRLKALSTHFNDAPHLASRPFDVDRDGFVMGEGAAVLVLEELQHALARQQRGDKVQILAQVTGYGTSGDGHHVTAPDPDGVGAMLCMQRALDEARIMTHHSTSNTAPPSSIYVNAHATSTPKGDEIETRAIERLFFDKDNNNNNNDNNDNYYKNSRILVSSTKGATGHLLGAAGALEAAFTIQALRDQCVPPTLNLQHAYVADTTTTTSAAGGAGGIQHPRIELVQDNACHFLEKEELDLAMSNSFGFGGTNACLVFQRWKDDDEHTIS